MEDRIRKVKAIKRLVVYVGVIFAMCTAFLSVLGVDHTSGFPEGSGNLLYVICPIVLALTLAARGYIKQTYEKDDLISADMMRGNIGMTVSSLVCAGAFLYGAISAFRESRFAYTALDAKLLTVLAILAAASAVVMLLCALSEFADADTSKVAYLRIVVIAYFALYALYTFKGYTIILSVPLQVIHIFALACTLLFLLESTKAYAGIGNATKVFTITVAAWISMFIYVVTKLVLFIMVDKVYSPEFNAGFVVEMSLLIFITVFAVKSPLCIAEKPQEEPEETLEETEITEE
jgi:hypothetical protein